MAAALPRLRPLSHSRSLFLSPPSAAPHPALRHPIYLGGEAHLHRLRGVLRGHAHPHHLAQGRPAHRARLRLRCGHRDQRLHEFAANHQGDAQAQRKLHLHRQQHRRHRQLGKTADRHRWGGGGVADRLRSGICPASPVDESRSAASSHLSVSQCRRVLWSSPTIRTVSTAKPGCSTVPWRATLPPKSCGNTPKVKSTLATVGKSRRIPSRVPDVTF